MKEFPLVEFITALWAGGLLFGLAVSIIKAGEARKPHNRLLVIMLCLLGTSYLLFAGANFYSGSERAFLFTFLVADGLRLLGLAAGAHFLTSLFPPYGYDTQIHRRAFAVLLYGATAGMIVTRFGRCFLSGYPPAPFSQLHSHVWRDSGFFFGLMLIGPTLNGLAMLDYVRRSAAGDLNPHRWWHGPRPGSAIETLFRYHGLCSAEDAWSQIEIKRITKRERNALLLLLLVGLAWPVLRFTPATVTTSYLTLAYPFVLAVPYVYVRCRFAFFDVFLRISIIATILIVSSFSFLAAGVPWQTCLLILGFTSLWLKLAPTLYRALKRLVLAEPDYRRWREPCADLIRRAATPQELTTKLAAAFQRLLRAEYCRFEGDLPEGCEHGAVLEVSAQDRLFGYFVMGSRARGQRYGREDLAFLQDLAQQAATMLRNFELRDLAHSAELKALQAQINPHFLFNALNTLAQVTAENPKVAEQLTLDLARVFRYVLTATKRDVIPLWEEEEFLNAYLGVEKARFEERLEYSIDIPETLRRAAIPPMLIQPLVENSLRHGFASKLQPGHLAVTVRSHDGWLRVSVKDDGVGFDPENVFGGTGLANVRARVDALPGRFRVQSCPGCGAEIWFEVKQ